MIAAALFSAVLSATAHARDCYYADRMATCGDVVVPEDRILRGRRRIHIRFVLVRGEKPAGVPVFFVAGGPGQSMIQVGRGVMSTDLGATLRVRHDLVFVDQRGTGASHPLPCALYGPLPTPAQLLSALFPANAVRACRTRLEARSDLSAYTSNAAADDLDAVRAALGYDQIALWGVSYGSQLSLTYIRRHGDRVQSAVLEDVAPSQFHIFSAFAAGGDAAIRAASAGFPQFRSDLMQLRRTAIPGISQESFVNGVLEALTNPQNASMLALLVHEAASGNAEPLARYLADRREREIHDLDMGMHLSIVCAEDIPFLPQEESARKTFTGGLIVRAYRRACAQWHVRPVDPAFALPVHSRVPVLMFSGADDPWTPPWEAARQLRYLRNGKQIVIPHAGHDLDSPALTQAGAAFIDAR